VGKSKDKRQDEMLMYSWWNNIKMDIKDVGMEDFGFI
jgi:hypothetical protein